MVAGFAFDRGEPGHFLVPFRCGFHEHDLSVFGQNDDVIAGQHDLAVAVSTALPLLLSVEARENRLVQPVNRQAAIYSEIQDTP